jgi:hypothetical protein
MPLLLMPPAPPNTEVFAQPLHPCVTKRCLSVVAAQRLLVLLLRAAVLSGLAASLSACDLLGIETPEQRAAIREAEGKALGGACRHAGRAIEDCYTLNRRADKAAMYAGWREMNDYMKENNIPEVAPILPRPGSQKEEEEEPKPAKKPAPKADAAAKPEADKADKAKGEAGPADKAEPGRDGKSGPAKPDAKAEGKPRPEAKPKPRTGASNPQKADAAQPAPSKPEAASDAKPAS